MLKIGVIGAGYLGKVHLKLLKEIKEYELVGFYDHDELNSLLVEKEFGVKSFKNFEELAALVDLIDIVTPATSHYDYANASLRMSKHIFVEKPLTFSTDDARVLVALASEANVKVQVGHVERFNPAFLAAKPFINHPLFIETQRLAQYNPRGMDVSVVMDVMIHDIDIVLNIVKSPVKRISASGAAVIGKLPDMANARLEFDNGCVANLTACRVSMVNKRETLIFQINSYTMVDFLNKKTEIISLKTQAGKIDGHVLTDELAKRKGDKVLNFESPVIAVSNSLKDELESFAQSIINNSETEVTVEDGFEAVRIANKIDDILRLKV